MTTTPYQQIRAVLDECFYQSSSTTSGLERAERCLNAMRALELLERNDADATELVRVLGELSRALDTDGWPFALDLATRGLALCLDEKGHGRPGRVSVWRLIGVLQSIASLARARADEQPAASSVELVHLPARYPDALEPVCGALLGALVVADVRRTTCPGCLDHASAVLADAGKKEGR